jgi:hypothetical protein
MVVKVVTAIMAYISNNQIIKYLKTKLRTMKSLKFFVAILVLGLFSSTADAQFNKLKDKLSGGGSGGAGKFEALNEEKDEMGITGQYFGLSDKKGYGFRFVKEADGKIVNQLHYFEKKMTPDPLLKLTMKESYFSKKQVKLFYVWTTASATGYIEILELEPGVFAQIAQSDQSVQDGPATLDATRKVKDVYAKDQEKFSTYDLETAQAKVDMIIASLNTEKMEKETAEWMKNDVFAKNVDKVVFADKWYLLQKQGYGNRPPMVKADGFKTELDMGGDMNYMGFFKYPPAVKYPGQQINIEYEMNGIKVNREECRKKSAAWSNMVKILETEDFNYRQSSVRAVREYNQYHSQFVQDYAAIQLLYSNKDKFKVDGVYTLTVRMYAHRDGENGDLVSEGTVKLKYSEAAKKVFEGDPNKPEIKGVWQHFEEFLNE